jgi:acetyl esterase/lipase
MLSWDWTAACARHYVGPDVPEAPGGLPQPLVSPLRADLHGLPPVLIQAGTDELLHPQALALHEALQAAGVDVRCEITANGAGMCFSCTPTPCPAPTPPSTAWPASSLGRWPPPRRPGPPSTRS